MSSESTSNTAAKQRLKRLRRNEVSRSTPFSRSARRRPLAAAGARLLHRVDFRGGHGPRLVHVRVERRSPPVAEGGGGRAGLGIPIREQAATRGQSRCLQGTAR